jgi:hypothetical protein
MVVNRIGEHDMTIPLVRINEDGIAVHTITAKAGWYEIPITEVIEPMLKRGAVRNLRLAEDGIHAYNITDDSLEHGESMYGEDVLKHLNHHVYVDELKRRNIGMDEIERLFEESFYD